MQIKGPSGLKYTIIDTSSKDFDDDEDFCDARISNSKQTIEIRDDAQGYARLLILGHEITHDILAWSGLSAIMSQHEGLEEAVCDAVSAGWIRFINENQPLIDELLGRNIRKAKIKEG